MSHHATRTLQEQGYRLTPQRTLVWDVLRQQGTHMSAEDICARVQERFSYVNISTVYRTLELLVDLRLVRETRLGPTRRFFEVEEDDPHHHLVCDSCGTVIHAHGQDLGALDAALHELAGFSLRAVTVFGLCESCRAAEGSEGVHIPDGFLNAPTAVATGAVSLGAVVYSVKKATRELNERTVPLLGVTAAFVFAAQMLNFPVAGGTSGHFLGAVLVAALMGPYAAVIVLTVVLLVQSLVVADGGITALGANILNMAIIGGIVGYLIFIALKRVLPKTVSGYFFSLAIASWLSVVLASAAASFELALSGTVPLSVALPTMSSVHMVIGIGEALITSTIVAAVLASRPDLVKTYDRSRGLLADRKVGVFGQRSRLLGFVAGAVVVAVALAVLVSPFVSKAPNGLEKVAADKGFAQAAATQPVWNQAPLKDYLFPGIHSAGVATAVAGGVGTILLFTLVLLIGRALGRRRHTSSGPPLQSGSPGGRVEPETGAS